MTKRLMRNSTGLLFRPTFIREGHRASSFLIGSKKEDITYESFKNTNLNSTASFRYGDKTSLVSTQQLRVDWTKFENHTFFNSGVSKVNEAFDKIVNFYPFEKSKKEIEQYEDDLTGFEKYVLDTFPKNVGYLVFSGTQVGESLSNGTQISVIDRTGANLSAISDRLDGVSVLDPKLEPFSFEFFIKVPSQVNDNQIVIQKYKSLSNHMTIVLTQSLTTNSCIMASVISSGSTNLSVFNQIDKGEFNHVTVMYDKNNDKRLKVLVNDTIVSSSNTADFGTLDYNNNNMTIGSGESFRVGDLIVIPQQTFSGSIDELKYFHKINKIADIKKNKYRTFFPTPGDDSLKLFYRFNEPAGTYTGNNIVLDSSGNSLHSQISNFTIDCRASGSDVPVLSENVAMSPVMFPTFPEIDAFNSSLLYTASLYDDYNPNIITRLIPHHYFNEGTNYRDFTEEFDKMSQNFSSFTNSNVGQGKSETPAPQLMLKLLLTYAKYYDELKMMIDAITDFKFTNYTDKETTPDVFLREKAKLSNTVLPSLFSNSNIEQFLNGVDLGEDFAQSQKNLYEVQNEIWRRIITEAPRMNLSKGTIDSIKSYFRNAGIEPDNILNIREYGGAKLKNINASRSLKKDVFFFINFANSARSSTGADSFGYPTDANIPRIKSGYLSASRVEPGKPYIDGTFVGGQSNARSDGLLTSGSFTYEGYYHWPDGYQDTSESIARFHVTGTLSGSRKEGCALNLIADDSKLTLYVRDSITNTTTKSLILSGANIFDKDLWYISLGKRDTHDFDNTLASSGSYFLRVGKQMNGEIIEVHSASSYFGNDQDSVFKNSNEYNTSGSFIVIGSQSFQDSDANFLNDNSSAYASPAAASSTEFYGKVNNIRFYSKYTTTDEWKNRVKNLVSVGSGDPLVNYNFNTIDSGSFERLRLETFAKQNTKNTDVNGDIRIFDFTQNNYHFEGENFPTSSAVLIPERINFEILSSDFDLNMSKNKVRIRSFEDTENLSSTYYSEIAPVHEIITSEESLDDNRLSIDMNVMKGLNENIMTMFSDYDFINDSIGSPNLLFADSYKGMSNARSIYFNNLIDKIDLAKYRSLFKWIDNSFTDAIYSIVPRSTNFLGINFVYESHVLERNKFRYIYDEIYLKANERTNDRNDIYMSSFVASVRRF